MFFHKPHVIFPDFTAQYVIGSLLQAVALRGYKVYVSHPREDLSDRRCLSCPALAGTEFRATTDGTGEGQGDFSPTCVNRNFLR